LQQRELHSRFDACFLGDWRPFEPPAKAHQQREGNEEFAGSAEPQSVTHLGSILAKGDSHKPNQKSESR
jgi:hypothetical protein